MTEKPCFLFKARNIGEEDLGSLDDSTAPISLDERKLIFEKLWKPLQSGIDEEINTANVQVISEVLEFVINAASEHNSHTIPTGLLVTSASPSVHLYEQLRKQISARSELVYVSVNSGDAPNLRTVLKTIIQRSIQQQRLQAVPNEDFAVTESGQKLLSYDFEVLRRWREANDVHKLVISFQNSESFDLLVLADLINFLQLWIDRVPTILLFDVGTSISNLQDRLPAAAVKCLSGRSFDAAKTDQVLENLFKRACSEARLRFGPALTNFVFQRSHDFTQSVESFVQSLKYGYMCHVYGNAGSLFLDENLSLLDVSDDIFEIVRHLPSFRTYVQSLLDLQKGSEVRELLESNEALFATIQQVIPEAHSGMAWLVGAVEILGESRRALFSADSPSFSRLYVKALSGELGTSPLLRETLMTLKKTSPEVLAELASTIYDKLITMPASDLGLSPDDFNDIQHDLQPHLNVGLGDNHDGNNETVTRRGKLSIRGKKTAKNSSNDGASFSKIVTRFHDLLEHYFGICLTPMKEMFLHEIVFCDSKTLVQNATVPRPRAVIERALSSPHDYLGCDCCSSETDGPLPTQPCTAVLYQLFVESGALVNVFDLWTAFKGIIEQKYEDEQLIMAMFFRSLAELRYMGMLKPSRRRVDHLGKLMWKGI